MRERYHSIDRRANWTAPDRTAVFLCAGRQQNSYDQRIGCGSGEECGDDREIAAEGGLSSLAGQLLVAMPQMGDPRFARSVIYLCTHSGDAGAMGLVVNKVLGALTLGELFAQLQIESGGFAKKRPVHFGGPVEPGRGSVLHTGDYREEATLRVSGDIAVTATLDIMRAIGKGEGPRLSLFALGYAGWAPGQLDAEIQANGWLSVAADEAILFDADHDGKWQRAMAKLGVDPTILSSEAGHA
jgi:putative transcriptional regulator